MAPLTLRSEHLSVTLDPERGGEVTSVRRPGKENVLAYHDWDSPLPAGRGPGYGSTELDWLSRYRAGWQFLFPNSGAESVVDGVPVAFHGEASLAPVSAVDAQTSRCTMRTVARLPLELERTVRLSSHAPTMLVEEVVRNIGSRETSFVWGHHPTFPAFPGAIVDLPAAKIAVEPSAPGEPPVHGGAWPLAERADGALLDVSKLPEDEMVRLLYLHELGAGWAALRNPPGHPVPGVAISWDMAAYPCVWLWLQNGDPGFPWYGRARMLGIEPQRAWPFDGLAGALRRGQALTLQPGASASSWLTLSVLTQHHGKICAVDRRGQVKYG